MQLLDNDNFSVEDLICNESFQEYCLGANLEDELLWRDWITQFPNKKADFEEAKHLVNILNVNQGSRIQQFKQLKNGLKQKNLLRNSILLKAIEQPIVSNRIGSEIVISHKDPASHHPYFYKYIGLTIGILVVVFGVYLFLKPSKNLVKGVLYSSGMQFSSGKSLRKTILLDDGTVVTLAKESSINLHTGFNKEKRELWLTGEAFFDVKHDAMHPFIVHTALNDVQVLGTTFNVKAYPQLKTMETVLIKGSIRVDSKKYPGHFVMLKPNQKLVSVSLPENLPATSKEQVYKISTFKINATSKGPQELSWVTKSLEIDNLPLFMITRKLQDWYGIKIEITDNVVKNYRYSGVFENETIIKTLEALQLSYPFQFKTEHDKIIITK